MASKHQPQRSCVVCRKKTDKRNLTRLVFIEDRLRVDRTGKQNGRGAYLCEDSQCWGQAASRTLLGKVLRRSLNDDDHEYLLSMMPS